MHEYQPMRPSDNARSGRHRIETSPAFAVSLAVLVVLMLVPVAKAASVLTQHNDNYRTGANLNETRLKPSNVNVTSFRKLFSRAVDGPIHAQPLYVENVLITTGPATGTTHNVVYAATLNSSVYAFDADSNADINGEPLWHIQFPRSGQTPPNTFGGVLSTPVIDLSTNTIYVVARDGLSSLCPGTVVPNCFRLHALDISDGSEKFGGPRIIWECVSGTGEGSIGGVLCFDANRVNNRPGLLLANGSIYISFGLLEGDEPHYHGWILAFNATNLDGFTGIYATTPNASGGGIWMGGSAPASDDQGNIYVMIGNSYSGLDVRTGGIDVGESFVKLNSTLNRQDWFMPCRADLWDNTDKDLGAGGPLLIPGTNGLIGGGKQNYLYALNKEAMGHYHGPATGGQSCTANQELNFIDQRIDLTQPDVDQLFGSPIFWAGPSYLYFWRLNQLKLYLVIEPQPPHVALQDYVTAPQASNCSAWLSLSANGSVDGIVWALDCNSTLHAFDAGNLTELWNSNLVPADAVGTTKWNPPTVANGKVYVGSTSNMLHVYGPRLKDELIMDVVNAILN